MASAHLRRDPYLCSCCYAICDTDIQQWVIIHQFRVTHTLAVLLMLTPTAASRRGSYVHGFADGFAHPLSGLDHIVAMGTAVSLGTGWPGNLAASATFLIFMTAGPPCYAFLVVDRCHRGLSASLRR